MAVIPDYSLSLRGRQAVPVLRSALQHCAVPVTHIKMSLYFLQFMARIFSEAVVSYEAVRTHLCFDRHYSVLLGRLFECSLPLGY